MSLIAVILIIILLGGFGWGFPYGGRPGYWGGGWYAGSGIGLILLIVLILGLTGRF